MSRFHLPVTLAVSAVLSIACAAPALASGGSGSGSGGGGGGGTAPAPATAPAVSLSPSSLTFASQELGTTSAAQTVTLTNTGTASLFINSTNWTGLDFLVPSNTNLCLGTSVAPGASCTIAISFAPGTTGTRTATMSVVDNAPSSPQIISMTGTGTSVNGPTPMTVDTTGQSCDATACDLGAAAYVKNFLFRALSTQGEATAPFTWSVAAGALPPGVTLFSDGEIYGTPTATGTYVFTAKVTDGNGQTATQPFRLTISPPPPPLTSAQQSCQHAPGSVTAPLAGPSIGGVTPSGQGLGDQSQLTACGGYTKITAQVKNVNLPDGSVLWFVLSGSGTVGRVTLTNHAATMPAFVTTASLRQQSMLVYRNPPLGGATAQTPILSGKFG